MKRALSLLATAALAVGVAVGPTSPAQAEPVGSCSIAMPATLVITNPLSDFVIPLQADCNANDTAAAGWMMVNSRTGEDWYDFLYEGTAPLQLTWDDDVDGFGTFAMQPYGAVDLYDNELTQNEVTVVVKAASKASLSVTRNRSSVTVTAGASYYNARLNRQIPWAYANVQIQAAATLSGPWTTMATVTTGTNGLGSKAIYAPSARYWRVLTPTTPSVFNRYSVPVYK